MQARETDMDAVIRKWGNSAALRLNAAAMKTAAFDIEQRVTIKATKGRIVIEAADNFEFKLDELVAGITPKNLHQEVDFGGPIGKEAL
jgi:antitoxin MazE